MADLERPDFGAAVPDVEVARRPSQTGVLLAALASGLPSVALVLAGAPAAWIAGAFALFFVGTFAAAIGMRATPKTGATARVTRAGLEIDGTLVAAREDLVSGTLLPRVRTHVLLTKRDGSVLDVGVLQRDDARRVLDALGLGAPSAAASFSIASPAWSTPAGIAGWIAAFVVMMVAAPLAIERIGGVSIAMFLALSLSLLAVLAPARVIVGTDALVVRWLGTKRVVDLADVVGVEALPHVVRLRHRDGHATDVRVGMPGRYAHTSAQSVAALAERIQSALAARDAGARAPVATALARDARSIVDWIAHLRRVATAEPTFRGAAVVPDRLWSLVEDATTDASTRVAAAVALAPTLDDEGRARVRVAAAATASPKLRVALEAAARDDADAVAGALDELEAERARQRK